jgi:hypothetical protein
MNKKNSIIIIFFVGLLLLLATYFNKIYEGNTADISWPITQGRDYGDPVNNLDVNRRAENLEEAKQICAELPECVGFAWKSSMSIPYYRKSLLGTFGYNSAVKFYTKVIPTGSTFTSGPTTPGPTTRAPTTPGLTTRAPTTPALTTPATTTPATTTRVPTRQVKTKPIIPPCSSYNVEDPTSLYDMLNDTDPSIYDHMMECLQQQIIEKNAPLIQLTKNYGNNKLEAISASEQKMNTDIIYKDNIYYVTTKIFMFIILFAAYIYFFRDSGIFQPIQDGINVMTTQLNKVKDIKMPNIKMPEVTMPSIKMPTK